jgi:diadenosine tetraphosphatase ApaH/serine/threonine PP2A family protein phosphatase
MTYVYEPEWESPEEELEISLNIYRRLVNRMHVYDDMEVIAYLPARDGIQWALEQLAEEVDPDILAEVEELDARLRAAADYLVHELDIYGDIWRDEPEEYWWWYLDGGQPDPGGIPSAEERHRWAMEMLKAEKMTGAIEMAEERQEYKAGEEK